MGVMGSFAAALAAVLVFGFAEVLAMSARQVYAMDLAPVERRGAFLGVSQGTSNIGQITGPLLIGQAADAWGFAVAFGIVAAVLVVAAGSHCVARPRNVPARAGRPRGRSGGPVTRS